MSYPLTASVPVYGQHVTAVEIRAVKSPSFGDSCRTHWVGFENHWGTHVDCPAHFFKDGADVLAYDAEFWHFHRPQLIDVALKPGQLLLPDELPGIIQPDTDLLLLRSGWFQYRGESVYSLENPGIDPSLAPYLRGRHPSVRAIGFDWISISSFMNREKGREAHRLFLDPSAAGNPILIFEDMDLSQATAHPKEVWAFPLRIEGVDSAPCTMIGVFP